jgi:3-hydroxy-9,10-secoandrosta-1,3,5(10)-triene-9,17-dione monooxygenase reductase component
MICEKEFRKTLGCFCTGVIIVTGHHDVAPIGFTAQSLISLSLLPPLVGIAIGKTSITWPHIRKAGRFGVNILTEAQLELGKRFASQGIDRFARALWTKGQAGVPILDGVLAFVGCDLETEYEVGDHVLAVGKVIELRMLSDEHPLLFNRGAFGSVREGALLASSTVSQAARA